MSNKTPRLTSRKSHEQLIKSNGKSPARRRSSRLSGNDENLSCKVVAPPVAVKRSITVRKIAPRKTQALSDSNKENVEKISEVPAKLSKVLTSSPAVSTVPKTTVLSPILPPSPPPQPTESEQDPIWSQKVRRSYSRLSMGDKSFESPKTHPARSSSPSDRESLFGFERLQTPEVMRKAEGSRTAPLGSMSFSVSSFNISAAADESGSNPPEVDPNIPGVCLGKKTSRRKRVQQIKVSELEVLAAKMNAEFEEAESFDLVVE